MVLRKESLLVKKLSQFILCKLACVRAEEPDGAQTTVPTTSSEPTGASVQATPQINYEQLVAQARKEEKDKLYPKINELKNTISERDKTINELMLTLGGKEAEIGTLKSELDKAKSGVTNSEEVTNLQTTIAQLKKELEDSKKQCTNIELDYYKKAKIAEAGGKLIPELVTGTTKEEIDQSVENSMKRYLEIVGVASQVNPQPQVTQTEVASVNADANAFLAGGINPSTSHLNSTNLSDELASIDVRTVEGRKRYAEIRKQLGL